MMSMKMKDALTGRRNGSSAVRYQAMPLVEGNSQLCHSIFKFDGASQAIVIGRERTAQDAVDAAPAEWSFEKTSEIGPCVERYAWYGKCHCAMGSMTDD
jgi:hypothetical protein